LDQLITIDCFGKPYTFKSEAGAVDPRLVADCLTEEVQRIEAGHTGKPAENSAFIVLLQAALNITSEHVQLKRRFSDMTRQIETKTGKLLETIESGIRRIHAEEGDPDHRQA